MEKCIPADEWWIHLHPSSKIRVLSKAAARKVFRDIYGFVPSNHPLRPELLDDHGNDSDNEMYGSHNFRELWSNCLKAITQKEQKRDFVNRFINELHRAGFTGIQYQGRLTMGGKIKHSAYTLWDENLINRYRIS